MRALFCFFHISRWVHCQHRETRDILISARSKDVSRNVNCNSLTNVIALAICISRFLSMLASLRALDLPAIFITAQKVSASLASFVIYVPVCSSSQLMEKRSQIVRFLGLLSPSVRQLVWNEHERSLEKCHTELFIYFSKSSSRKHIAAKIIHVSL